MPNTNCTYLGLTLQSPVIAGSCGLTNSIDKMKKMEEYGVGAVVLKSVFEEQISQAVMQSIEDTHFAGALGDAFDYIKSYSEMDAYGQYTHLVRNAKKELSVPVIASINCFSDGDWISYAKQIQDAGADALELNLFFLPSDYTQSGTANEDMYFKIIEHVKANISIPLAIKTSYYFSGLAKMLQSLSYTGIKGLVLFNRFSAPDINIEKMQLSEAPVFTEGEGFYNSLRWISIMSNHVNCSLCASSGVASGEDVVKQLLAGADAIQVVTSLYNQGLDCIRTMNDILRQWMTKHNFTTIDEFKGKMNFDNISNPNDYLRIQFMKHFAGIEENKR
ncbi:MAG: dihydroorotate dehydrogenase-like protein [Bacteroidales bacterium]|jgi:dihydroorotate dehydrogenase (fumarate)|nr:dihydroorotate dehydrogenase-like protein [Bacteroidales bacterium]